ncbi:Metallo-hydrolase/oxidoreductase [Ceratobasidium sp. AG-I]|nr:Metallo-hydrolase/oxidoreductase [Ceratobasidium sp. AG-I]
MDLPSIQQLGPLVIRILGQNPGKFTLQGTNTFLIGRTAPYILIDTGEGKPEYIPQLKTQLDASSSSPCPISDIILTHKHFDHHGGLVDVLGHLSARRPAAGTWTPPRVHIHPLPQGVTDQSLGKTIAGLQDGTYTPHSSSPFFPLSDGSKLRTQDESAELEVIHTPGHTIDSICLVLSSLSPSQEPKPEALFTADTVLGAGTGVFENLSTYMSSLARLVSLPIWPAYLHPGHGPSIPPESAKAHIEAYISHREARENQIIGVLKGEGRKSVTVGGIVKTLYAEYPERLWAAAAHGVGLHLKKLESEGRVRRLGSRAASPGEGMVGARMEDVGAAGMDVEWEWKEDNKL